MTEAQASICTSCDTAPRPTWATPRYRYSSIMGKTRHRNPHTAMRYVKPGTEAIAAITEHLAPPRRRH
ncbi:hypothetical protein [Sphaerisporangium dianthi]|uniref:Uncharacterized protein n=1 Tax=Sphaerisporangium dianthi TaxID=1436120 RepID=A0ABV9CVX0_9ACTN